MTEKKDPFLVEVRAAGVTNREYREAFTELHVAMELGTDPLEHAWHRANELLRHEHTQREGRFWLALVREVGRWDGRVQPGDPGYVDPYGDPPG